MKIAIVLAVLMIGVSISYRYFIYLPELDRVKKIQIDDERRAEQKKITEEKEEESAKKNQRKLRYDACILSAITAYDLDWISECKSNFEVECLPKAKSIDKSMRFLSRVENQPYNGEALSICNTEKLNWSGCKLPPENANRVNEELRNAKEACIKKAQLDL